MSTKALDTAIGMLRQWLNEERIKDANYFVTNEELHAWLDKAIASSQQVGVRENSYGPTKLSQTFDELADELANYWYQEHKYTANSRWQECKDEADAAITQAVKQMVREAKPDKKPAEPLADTDDEQFYGEIGFNQGTEVYEAALLKALGGEK